MQLAPQETIDALAGAVWLPVLAVEPEGSAICQCIRTTHPSGLYITRDGIITHNSSPQETNARGKSDPVPQSILRSQPDRILAALAKEDEIFRYPKTAATSIEEALRDINPGIIFLGDVTRPDERQESTADLRLLFKTELGREFYVYEREDRGGDVWIDVSRLEEGEQGGAIYAAIGDYAANTRRTFVGDPAGLSEAAMIQRTSHMISLALRHGTTAHMKPSPEQLQGRPGKGIAGFEWKGNDESRFHALVDSFLATIANLIPGIGEYRYDFEHGTFLDPRGRSIRGDALQDAGRLGFSRGAKAGKRTLGRAIFLKSLLEESASGEGRSELLGRFLSRRHSLKKVGLHELFSQSAPIAPERMAKLDAHEARAAAEVDGNRTVGNHLLAFSTASTQWMAADELRKHEFERQLERDWTAVAERMLRNDPAGVREDLLDAAAEGKTLTPIQTKAAQLLIAAESALPRTPERRAAIYQLIEAYRATGAEASRSLSARQDPFATPLQRWRAFFAEQIYTPPARIRRLMDGALWERKRDAQIARLRKVIADAANTSTAAASQAREEIKRLEEARTKESLMRVDYETRVKKIESALAKMGITLDDIFDGEIKLSLIGAEVVKHTASAVHGRDRAILRDLQGKHGGNISDIAKRHKVSLKEVLAIQKEFEANLREKFLEKARRGIREDELETEGISDALLSQTERKIPTEEEAQKIADRMMRMAGFFGKDHDRMKIRKPRKEKPARKPAPNQKPGPIPSGDPVPPTPLNQQPGLDLHPGETAITGEGRTTESGKLDLGDDAPWEGAITGEGRTTESGKLDLGDDAPWEGATAGEGRTTESGKLDLGDDAPWEGATAYKLNPKKLTDRLSLKRAIDIASGNHSFVDYATEIGIANLLSAPVTAITNITGFAYAAYELTAKKLFRASYNAMVKKSADADQLGEFRAMGEALAPAIARAWVNARHAWDTESPIFEESVLNTDMSFDSHDFTDQGIRAHISGKKGRWIRTPFRVLLASDEFMKTIIGTTHAAAVAFRSGTKQGLKGKDLTNHITTELGEVGSRSWNIAAQEARRLTFQTPLRGTNQWRKMRDEGELGIAAPLEFGVKFLQDVKNLDAYDASMPMKGAILMARMFFPFIRTPYRLLEFGINETILGAGNSLLHAHAKTTVRDADGKKIVHHLKGDAAKVAAAATAIHAALFTIALAFAAEGDDDDDEKFFLFSGSAPGEDKEISRGMRAHAERTMPPYSLRIGGKNGVVISYQRIDPFSTAIASTVDWIKNVKQSAAGKRSWQEGSGKFISSLYSQILDKASLRGFSELSGLLSGSSSLPEYASRQIAAWTVPNLIRNPARNSDPYVRESSSLNPIAQIPYQMLPVAALAPPARRDVFGDPLMRQGNFVSRTLLPGNPRLAPQPNAFDRNLKKYNLRNPTGAFAPDVPRNTRDSDTGEYKYTPQQYARFTTERGRIFRRMLTDAGYMQPGKRLVRDDIEAIREIGAKATRAANKAIGLSK